MFQSWVEGVDVAGHTSYYHDMVARFLELGLCKLDWESEQIASKIYSHWQGSWINKQEAEWTKGKDLLKQLVKEFDGPLT